GGARADDENAHLLQQDPQVVQAIEQVPDVAGAAVDAVRMQVGELRVVAVAVESRLRIPLDQDQHLARLDVAGRGLAELAERHHAPAVRLHLLGGALRVGEVLPAIGYVEQVQRIDLHVQIFLAASTQSLSLARSLASVTGLPPIVLANPHCGLMARFFIPMNREASSVLLWSESRFSN